VSQKVQALTVSGHEASLEIGALHSRIAVLLAEVEATKSDNDFKTSLLAALSVDDANKVNVATTLELERYRSEFFGQLRDLFEDQNGVRIEGDRLVLSSEVLFESGRALLSRLGESEIAKIALILRVIADEIPSEINWVIRVDGHTDNIPLSGVGAYADNWELSQARALTVVKHMVEVLGIPPSKLAATGFGEFQPISFEDTPEARAQNRRIELVFTEK
jgi:chemotaxis protein MotB